MDRVREVLTQYLEDNKHMPFRKLQPLRELLEYVSLDQPEEGDTEKEKAVSAGKDAAKDKAKK